MKKTLTITTLAAACLLLSCTSIEQPSQPAYLPSPEQPATKAYGDKSPKIIVTVDVTSNINPLNAGDYCMPDGEPFFDVVDISSAHIHKETVDSETRPTLYLNDKLASLLENTETHIRPLQDMGIKVMLSVMGDWQGIGFSNLNDTQADQFAAILAYAVNRYGLDGISFDDEYASYAGSLVDGSYGNLVKKLRSRLGSSKLVSVWETGYISQFDTLAGSMLSYAYNCAGYLNKLHSSIPGVSDDRWARYFINIGNPSNYNSTTFAHIRTTTTYNYGAITCINLIASPSTVLPNLQGISNAVYYGATIACEDGSRAWDISPVSGGVTITYDMTLE